MKELSLFTGAGGGILGSKILGWQTIGYVEYEKFCQKIIRQRIADGILDSAPIFGDIRRFISEGYAEAYKDVVDIITGGFPCQPFSSAGSQNGEFDPRNMWPQTLQCLSIIRPKFAFLENVPGLLSFNYFGRIIGDLAETGYYAKWLVMGAKDVGAIHSRKRLWIFAYPKSIHGISCKKEWGFNLQKFRRFKSRCFIESKFGRKYDGMENDVDRLKAIGNGQVPLCMAYAFSILSQGIVE